MANYPYDQLGTPLDTENLGKANGNWAKIAADIASVDSASKQRDTAMSSDYNAKFLAQKNEYTGRLNFQYSDYINRLSIQKAEYTAGIQTQKTRIDNIVSEISDEAFNSVVDSATVNWLPPVADFSSLSSTYPSASNGDASQTLDDNKTYRFDGTSWVFIQQFGLGPFTPIVNDLKTGVGLNIIDFPRLNGETSDMPRFQRAITEIENAGGGRLVVPKSSTPYLFQFVPGSTILSPTRIMIQTDNVEIVGIGNPTIEMKGLTTTYLFSIDDYASSGRDIFTAFSFAGVQNCGVKGIRFVGEYTGDEVFRYQSPRSIAVAFKGASNCYAESLEGENILGNLVNIVNSNITYDAPFALSENVTVENVRAVHCLENGINYMGGTKNSVAANIVSTGCANGLESACEGFTLNGAVLIGNRSSGLGLSGKNQIVNGVVATDSVRIVAGVPDPSVGFGLVITGGENIQVNGGKFNDNYSHGIYIYPGVKKVQLNNPEVRRNAKEATNKIAIQMVGTSLKRIQDVNIFGGEIEAEGAVTGSIVNFADNVRVMSMKGTFESASSSFSFASDCNGSQAIGNRFNKGVTMNDPTGEEYNNGLYRKIDRTSAPTTGTWVLGDIINNRSRSQGSIAEWNIIQSGTFGTLNSGSTTGSITSGTTSLTVNSATGLYKGAYILIAGISGVKRVVSVSGTTVTLDVAADTTVTSAAISYRAPIVIPTRQNGPKTVITATPDYVGQIAVTGGTTPAAYIAVGTSSTSDWKQINN